MEIKSPEVKGPEIIAQNNTLETKNGNLSNLSEKDFSKELTNLQNVTEEDDAIQNKKNQAETNTTKENFSQNSSLINEHLSLDKSIKSEKYSNVIDNINNMISQVSELEMLQTVDSVKVNQSDEKIADVVKIFEQNVVKNQEGVTVINNNDLNISEHKDIAPQINLGMDFSGDKQPFSSFMEENKGSNNKANVLGNVKKELEEEAAILSTMAENIAIANRNEANKALANNKKAEESKEIKHREKMKNIDIRNDVVIERVVRSDNVIMNQADVEVFADLVQNGNVVINNLAPKSAKHSIQVSKNLADMLADSMKNNQPLRIDFDNNISVIIRISRDGKLSADFLPSSQVAEAYLKENLPLLKQKFDEENLPYEELNQKNQRNKEQENNRRKGRKDE